MAKMINEGNATEILQKSAQQGDKEAQFQLGVMYENGHGVEIAQSNIDLMIQQGLVSRRVWRYRAGPSG